MPTYQLPPGFLFKVPSVYVEIVKPPGSLDNWMADTAENRAALEADRRADEYGRFQRGEFLKLSETTCRDFLAEYLCTPEPCPPDCMCKSCIRLRDVCPTGCQCIDCRRSTRYVGPLSV